MTRALGLLLASYHHKIYTCAICNVVPKQQHACRYPWNSIRVLIFHPKFQLLHQILQVQYYCDNGKSGTVLRVAFFRIKWKVWGWYYKKATWN